MNKITNPLGLVIWFGFLGDLAKLKIPSEISPPLPGAKFEHGITKYV